MAEGEVLACCRASSNEKLPHPASPGARPLESSTPSLVLPAMVVFTRPLSEGHRVVGDTAGFQGNSPKGSDL